VSVSNPSWSVHLIGKFEVKRPDGSLVRFPTRKAEALVALLALHPDRAVPRIDLAEGLWAESDRANQLTNLRQALHLARSAFGNQEAIESDRSGCRLKLPNLVCDAIEVLEGRAEVPKESLLPAMTETVFNDWRVELACLQPELANPAPIAALPTLLDWALGFDPPRVLDIAYTTPELISALPLEKWGRTLSTALESNAQKHPLYGWGCLQLANVMMWKGDYRQALANAKLAVRHAEASGDNHTLTGALFTAGYVLTMLGKWNRAAELIDSGRKAVAGRIDIAQERRLDHAMGHVLAHQGDIEGALHAMLRNHTPEPDVAEETAWAFRAVHQSCFLALLGKTQEARKAFNAASAISRRLAHPLLETQILLAKATTLLAENDRAMAISVFQALEKHAKTVGSTPTMIHAVEGIAMATEDPVERANRFAQADILRREHELGLLPIDRMRIGMVQRR
jgi:tetratricopeptide (TPR) repeat protein